MKQSRYQPLSEINVTNLVDVTLVLLIIFMITSPLLQRGIDVTLPKAQGENIQPRDALFITMALDGTLSINQKPVQDAEFERLFAVLYETSGKPPVYLRADTQIPYGRVVALMGRLKKAQVTHLGLVVEPVDRP